MQAKASRLLMLFENRKVIRAQPADDIGFTRLEAKGFGVCTAHEQRDDLVQVGKPVPLSVRFPIVGIALQCDVLARNVLSHAKGAEAGDLTGGSCEAPSLRQLSLRVDVLQEMARQDRYAVEQT